MDREENNLPLFTINKDMSNGSGYFENIWWQNGSGNQSPFKFYTYNYLRDFEQYLLRRDFLVENLICFLWV